MPIGKSYTDKCTAFSGMIKDAVINRVFKKGSIVASGTTGNKSEDELCEINDNNLKAANVTLANVLKGEYRGCFGGSKGEGYDIRLKDSIDDMTSFITADNIDNILAEYEKIDKDGLINTVFDSEDYTKSEKINFAFHILKCKEESAANKGCFEIGDIISNARYDIGLQDESDTNILDSTIINNALKEIDKKMDETLARGIQAGGQTLNGKIDENFSQGQAGDCWLLAAIKSIASTPKGAEVLNNSINVIDKDTVEVTLLGVGKQYTVSRDEIIEKTGAYSTGDGDVTAFEIAMEKYFNEEQTGCENTIENGGREYYAYKAFLGDAGSAYYTDKTFLDSINRKLRSLTSSSSDNSIAGYDYLVSERQHDSLIKRVQEPNFVCTVSAHSSKVSSDDSTAIGVTALDEDDKDVNLYYNHAYSVLNSDEEYVYIVNPWDTSSTLKLTHEDFMHAFNYATMYDLDS